MKETADLLTGDAPRRGVLLTSSIIVPNGLDAGAAEYFTGVRALSDAIAETFRWTT